MRIEWNASNRTEWTALTRQARLEQQWAYGDALEAVGAPALRATVRVGRETRAIAQFSLGGIARLGVWAICSRGPVFADEVTDAERAEILRRLRAEIPLKRPRAVFFLPDAPLGAAFPSLAGLRRVMTGFHTVELDLSPNIETLRAGLHGKWRNRLTVAERSGLRVRELGRKPGQYEWLLEREAEQRKRKRYLAAPVGVAPAYQRASVDKRSVRVLSAEIAREPVAAIMLMTHGHAATYHIGWTSEAGRRSGAHNLLLWDAMRRLKNEGLARFDLGEVDTQSGAGLARFKLGAGGRAKTLCGAFF